MKRKLRSVHDVRELTPEEQRFDNWKMAKLFELGLACTYGSDNTEEERKLKIQIFGSEINHMKAEAQAMKFINVGKEVPEPTRSKLIEYKNLLSTIQ